jgi:hypothetical protein
MSKIHAGTPRNISPQWEEFTTLYPAVASEGSQPNSSAVHHLARFTIDEQNRIKVRDL